MAVWSRSDGPDLKLGSFSFWRKLKFVWDWTVWSWSDSHAVTNCVNVCSHESATRLNEVYELFFIVVWIKSQTSCDWIKVFWLIDQLVDLIRITKYYLDVWTQQLGWLHIWQIEFFKTRSLVFIIYYWFICYIEFGLLLKQWGCRYLSRLDNLRFICDVVFLLLGTVSCVSVAVQLILLC